MRFVFFVFAWLLTSLAQADRLPMHSSTLAQRLAGEGLWKAEFSIFAGVIEMRSPRQTIDGLTYLRDTLRWPIGSIFLETEHTGASGTEIEAFLTIAKQSNFTVMVRVGSGRREIIKGVLGQGAGGIIVPLIATEADIKAAFQASFYSAPPPARDIGFEDATQWLVEDAEGLARRTIEVDKRTVLALMIEKEESVEKIDQLARYTQDLCVAHGIAKSNIIFWWGPYDRSFDAGRISLEQMRLDVPVTDEDYVRAIVTAQAQSDEKLLQVAATVKKYGFSMGGHTTDLAKASHWVDERGFKIFTVAGFQTSLMNGPTVRSIFADPMAPLHLNRLRFDGAHPRVAC